MTQSAARTIRESGDSPLSAVGAERVQLHQYFVPHFKSKSKSRANALVKEFLSRVFASDGASRFFKTFLLRFLFDGGGKSSDDCSGTAGRMFAPALQASHC